jgi:hypothetical protein
VTKSGRSGGKGGGSGKAGGSAMSKSGAARVQSAADCSPDSKTALSGFSERAQSAADRAENQQQADK